jgi:hypothetical protein
VGVRVPAHRGTRRDVFLAQGEGRRLGTKGAPLACMARLLAIEVALIGLISVFESGAGCSSSTNSNACSTGTKLIQASDYDQSCRVDADCWKIVEGDACDPCGFSCLSGRGRAINVAAMDQYNSDVANTPAVAREFNGQVCTETCIPSSSSVSPCCVGGTCELCPAPVSSVTCALGAACSSTDLCMGGIAGCTSNCQCLNGTWQAPCPTDLPQTGSACTPEGAECGYATSTNTCGADNCYCQSGTWSCGPSCIILMEDAGVDASGFPIACVDAGPVPNCTDADIEAKNYDQSCQTDSDCVLVGEGESCFPCSLAYGPYGAISRSDLARFEADVARTPAGNLPVSCAPACAPSPSACCLGGKCQVGSQCSNPTSTDAGADTGARDAASDAVGE